MWEVRVRQDVGSRAGHLRDFELIDRNRPDAARVRFIVTVPWNDRRPEREQTDEWVAKLHQWVREIAAQEELPVRR